MQVLEYILRTYPELDFVRLQTELRRARYLELEAKVGTIAGTLIAESEASGEVAQKAKPLVLLICSSADLAHCLRYLKLKSWMQASASLINGSMECLRRKVLEPFLAIFTE